MTRYALHPIMFLLIICMLAIPASTLASSQNQTINVPIPVGDYNISTTASGHEIYAEDYGYLLVPGKPALPSRIFAIAIPPGAEILDVSFSTAEGVILPGEYDIPPAPLTRVIGDEDPALYERDKRLYDQNHQSVYGSDNAYPSTIAEFVRTAGWPCRSWS